jgi:hypothetical protein
MNSTDADEVIRLDRSEPYLTVLSTYPDATATEGNVGIARKNLDRALTEALQNYQGSSDGGRRGTRMAIGAACEFIAVAAPQCKAKFNLINMVLVAALSDLDRGVVAPLVKKIGRGREKDSLAYRDIQHRAAATMASLMQIEFNHKAAAKKVADTLVRNGLRNATPRAVEKWYEERLPASVKRKRRPRTSKKRAQDPGHSYAYDLYVSGTSKVVTTMKRDGCKQNKICDALLYELAYFIQLWIPAPGRNATNTET